MGKHAPLSPSWGLEHLKDSSRETLHNWTSILFPAKYKILNMFTFLSFVPMVSQLQQGPKVFLNMCYIILVIEALLYSSSKLGGKGKKDWYYIVNTYIQLKYFLINRNLWKYLISIHYHSGNEVTERCIIYKSPIFK